MTMHWLDWMITLIPLAVVMWIAYRTQRYVRGVSDFLAAGRAAGRYLIANAAGEAAMGTIALVAMFEAVNRAGFTMGWWGAIRTPVALFMTLTGYVIYRYRQTRVMTMAQFFEVRYSKKFRVFMGVVAWFAGVLNYGIFPAVATRFFIYYCGFPDHFEFMGHHINTMAPMMFILLGSSLTFTLLGGHMTAMIVDCIEGIISGAFFILIAAALMWMFSWKEVTEAMTSGPANQSMMDPFHSSGIKDFNLAFVLIGIALMVYQHMSWQGQSGFNASAASPHEAKMGGILGKWRDFSRGVMITLLGVCAFTYMNHPHFHEGAAAVNSVLAGIDNVSVQNQMRTPAALGHFLPVGIRGALCGVMIFGMVAVDTSYLNSWGSIFVQDVLLPFKKTPLTPGQHIRWLRFSMTGVAVFAYFFGLFYRPTDFILMFFAITGAIFLGGAGAVILGGFYWKKGTTTAAWVSMITGSTLSVSAILIRQIPKEHFSGWGLWLYELNGQWKSLFAAGTAMTIYIVVSLLTCKQDFNLDKMLRRGAYSVDEEGRPLPPVPKPPRTWKTLLGIDAEFTRGDTALSVALFCWSMFWVGVFVVISSWNLFVKDWPVSWWSNYWYGQGIILPFVIGIVTTIWFTYGGVRDLIVFFRRMESARLDVHDDGTVRAEPEPELEVVASDAESPGVGSAPGPGVSGEPEVQVVATQGTRQI